MCKNNYYSPELKIQIIKEYLNGGISYNSLIKKYNIKDTHTIRVWVKKYKEFGELYFYEEKRGRKSSGRPLKELDFDSLSKDEQIKYLQKQLYHKQLENDVLKKSLH